MQTLNRVYWTTNTSPPACDSTNYFEFSALACQRALDALAANQGGSYQDFFAQYDPGTQDRWESLSNNYHSRTVECADDLPDPTVNWPGHGDGNNASAVYPRDGDHSRPWTRDPGLT